MTKKISKKKDPTKLGVKKSPYNISVKVFGKVYQSSGDSVIDALKKLEVKGKVGGMVIVQLDKEGVHREKVLNGNHLWRLLNGSSLFKEIAEKQLKTMFGEI